MIRKEQNEDEKEFSDPAKIIEENFSIEKTLEQLLEDVEEQVRTKNITIETAHELRKIYRSYLSGNTAVSFTTDKFIQLTAVELTFILGKILAKDYYKGNDPNKVIAEVSSIVDTISLALKRSLGGKERTLILSGFRVWTNPYYREQQEENKGGLI